MTKTISGGDRACCCGTKKPFNQCCGRFLLKQEIAKTPEQLMRSRYCAYALGGYGQYLLETWFPATAQGLSAEMLSQKSLSWVKLDVIEKTQQGDEGTVEFKAYHLRDIDFETPDSDADITQLDGNRETESLGVLHEISEFRRIAGRWYYLGGLVK